MENNVEKWLRLATMVFSDVCPRGAPIYLFGETSDNEVSSFKRVSRECDSDILISGGSNAAGYPGAPEWIRMLDLVGIASTRVEVIPLTGPPNTKTEADALVSYTEGSEGSDQGCPTRGGFRSVAIVAPPFHQLRCFLTVLGSMKAMKRMSLRVYNLVGVPLSWQEPARHSQGSLKDVRENLIGHEFERILRYTEKGDLVTVDEALAYLRQRDNP